MGSSVLFRAQSITIGHLLYFASFSAEVTSSREPSPILFPPVLFTPVTGPMLTFLYTTLLLPVGNEQLEDSQSRKVELQPGWEDSKVESCLQQPYL